MSARDTFHFNGYTLAPASEAHNALAEAWSDQDEAHKGNTPSSFWTEQGQSREAYLLTDTLGPVLFLKLYRLGRKTVQVHVQFRPIVEEQDRRRIRDALIEGFSWLEHALRAAGMERVNFSTDTATPQLLSFCKKRLGFVESGPLFVREL